MVETRNVAMAQALIRCIEAQPYMSELIDTVALFGASGAAQQEDDEFELLVTHLRQMIYPEAVDSVAASRRREERLTLVKSLTLNKRTEARAKCELLARLGDSNIDMLATVQDNNNDQVSAAVDQQQITLADGQVIATSSYILDKAKQMLQEMQEKPFGHFVIRGPSGSGKMTQIRLLHHLHQT